MRANHRADFVPTPAGIDTALHRFRRAQEEKRKSRQRATAEALQGDPAITLYQFTKALRSGDATDQDWEQYEAALARYLKTPSARVVQGRRLFSRPKYQGVA